MDDDAAVVVQLLDAAEPHGLTEDGLEAVLALKYHIEMSTTLLNGLLSGQLDARRIRPGAVDELIDPDDFEFSPRDPSTLATRVLP